MSTVHVVSVCPEISFAPASREAEIIQNVRTILSTIQGTVPLDRDFGISPEALDLLTPVSRAKIRVAVVDAINAFEPRAKVVSVSFNEETSVLIEGISYPSVEIEIEEESDE